ncbi:uncharacterized transporter slc-17.2-like [Planococcus citri]|uniref:uncharacterized transporter slc-17.2-like n=1 Tax=Planococcus citri TaxID=170843 RepID=UPI0031F7BF8D
MNIVPRNRESIMKTNATRNQNGSVMLQKVQDDKKWQTSETRSEIDAGKPPLLFSKRLLIAVLLFLTNANMIFVRYNVNVAVVEMAFPKPINASGHGNGNGSGNDTEMQPAEFQWDSKTVGLVLSILFYGNLLSFLSGFVISKMGGSKSMSIMLLICGITTFLHPIALRSSFYLFLFCRFMTGIMAGFANASLVEACSHWMPKSERGTLMAICFNGLYVATAIIHPIVGFIISVGGWPMVFYSTGVVSFLLSLVCLILIRNHPSEDNWISKKELSYILEETTTTRKRTGTTYPYIVILTSVPVAMLCIMNLLCSWSVSIVLTSLPLFLKDSTGKGTEEVAFISSLPCILGIFISLLGGPLMDYWKNHSSITLTQMHKIVIGIAYTTQFILLVAVTFVQDLVATIIIFVLISLFQPLMSLLLQLICVNLAPNHTGLIAGYTFIWYATGPIAAQTVAGFMTPCHSISEWNSYFLLTAGIILFGTVLFVLYGSSEPQPWSMSPNSEKKLNLTEKNEEESVTSR